jgi:hypothetical protein
MSTKTTFKRIALVTVAALGFGMISVAPSTAALSASALDSAVTGVSVTALTSPARVGTPVTTSFKITNTATTADDVLQFRALVTQVPTGSLLTAYTGAAFTNAYASSGVYDNTGTPARATVAATAGSNTTALGPKVTFDSSNRKAFYS